MNQQTTITSALMSQVGRKILTGITGVLLVLFIIAHLAANLQLLVADPHPFNNYSATLHSFGVLLDIVEILLALVILLHAWIGVVIYLRKRKARSHGYAVSASKGGPSKQTLSSRTMIWTGLVLLVFIVIHVVQFRFGPGIKEGFVYSLDGRNVPDLYRLVVDTFQNIWWVIFYVAVMVLIGFHLRHGIWSALQSLGAMKPKYTPVIYGLALVLGILIAVGFLILPIWIYVQGGAA